MKKIILIIILCFNIIIGCSCSYKDIYVLDVANNVTNITTDSSLWNNEYFVNDSAARKKEIVFNDVKYECSYTDSKIRNMQSYITDYYTCSSGYTFGLNSNTQELVYLRFMNNDFFETEPYKEDVNDPEVFAFEFAENIAKDFINLEDYEVIKKEPKTSKYNQKDKEYSLTYYDFTFEKKINNISSSDYISIKITSKGNVASISVGDIGAFNTMDEIDFSIDTINNLIANKANRLCKSIRYKILNTEIDSHKLVKTPDGDYAIYSGVKVLLEQNDVEFTSGLCLLYYLRK